MMAPYKAAGVLYAQPSMFWGPEGRSNLLQFDISLDLVGCDVLAVCKQKAKGACWRGVAYFLKSRFKLIKTLKLSIYLLVGVDKHSQIYRKCIFFLFSSCNRPVHWQTIFSKTNHIYCSTLGNFLKTLIQL
jgi:hypothetical protein